MALRVTRPRHRAGAFLIPASPDPAASPDTRTKPHGKQVGTDRGGSLHSQEGNRCPQAAQPSTIPRFATE